MMIAEASIDTHQLCTFFVDQVSFGVDVTKVQEVIRYQEMTPVPLASPVVSGLINLRGQIVTAIDMRRLLALPPRPDGELPMNVVVRSGESAVSLLVDEIGDVVDVDSSAFERPPETLTSHTKDLVLGVYKLADKLLLLLNTELATRGSELDSAKGNSDAK
ncbi:MAG: chemotaxis protein CheW [Polyangiaceae bacterium]